MTKKHLKGPPVPATKTPAPVSAAPSAPKFTPGRVTQAEGEVVLHIEAQGVTGTIPLTLSPGKIAEILGAVPWPDITESDAVEAFTDAREALLEIQDARDEKDGN